MNVNEAVSAMHNHAVHTVHCTPVTCPVSRTSSSLRAKAKSRGTPINFYAIKKKLLRWALLGAGALGSIDSLSPHLSTGTVVQ